MLRILTLAFVLPVLLITSACSKTPNSDGRASQAAYLTATAASNAVSTPTSGAPAVLATLGPLPTTSLTYPGGALQIELAVTEPQRQRGLGFRDTLPADAGMLFDLETAQVAVFWMKGMRFPLDMVWIGDDKKITSVSADVPPQPGVPDAQLLRYSSTVPVRYVLELHAGAAVRLGLAAGTQLGFQLP